MYSTNERVVLAGDLNAQVGEKSFDTFLYQHELTSINRNPTCYKNPNNPSPKSFFKTEAAFTGLSDFYKLVLSVFKLYFSKTKAKEISYRDFRDFKENNFNQDLQKRLSAQSVEQYAPFGSCLCKVVRANHAPYITKTSRKAIIKWSYLEKSLFQEKNSRFIKKIKKPKELLQQPLQKRAGKIFRSFDPRRISDIKVFGKIFNLFSLKNERLARR